MHDWDEAALFAQQQFFSLPPAWTLDLERAVTWREH